MSQANFGIYIVYIPQNFGQFRSGPVEGNINGRNKNVNDINDINDINTKI